VPRALSMTQSKVSADDRADFRFRAMRARTHYSAAGCNYWLFESDADAGTYVEFIEGPDGETLRRARRMAPGADESAPTFTEIPLT
jgi:hypothetical protein